MDSVAELIDYAKKNPGKLSDETVKGYELVGWFSLMAPGSMPAPLANFIADAVLAEIDNPDIKSKLINSGLLLSTLGLAEFKAYFMSEIKKLSELIKPANIKVQQDCDGRGKASTSVQAGRGPTQ